MSGSVCGSVFSSSISVLLGFNLTPEMRSTKSKPLTWRLADGMSISSVSGVGVLISLHVGHGSFEALQNSSPFHILGGNMYYMWPCALFGRSGRWSRSHLYCCRLWERYAKIGWYFLLPSGPVLCDPSDDVTRFVVLAYIVWIYLLLGIALRSTVLPLGSLLAKTEVCPVPLCALYLLALPVEQFRMVRG